MKKILSILLVFALVLTFAACAGTGEENDSNPSESKEQGSNSATTEPANDDGKIRIAEVVASTGSIDDRSFCQGTYEGIKKYADENGISYGYYQSVDDSVAEFVNTIKLAVNGGAEIVIAPGYSWNAAIYEAQSMFPDTAFVIVDGEPNNGTETVCGANTYSIYFAEQQAGYLAGYAAVVDGYRALGFIGGMAVPAVVRYGYGYIQGIEDAAKDLGLQPGDITLRYHYLGNWDPSPENQTFCTSWYSSGTDCIFFCAGDVTNVGMAAAKQVGPEKAVIGVDVNQGYEDECVLTSAMKGVDTATYSALQEFYAGTFPGGQIVTLDASQGGVGLPLVDETWRFNAFTKEDYDALFEKLASGEIQVPTDTDYETADQIPVTMFTVEIV